MADDETSSICCISHYFRQSASTNPTKIAVVHAHNRSNQSSTAGSSGRSFNEFPKPESNSRAFEGDECFTYSDVMAAVDSLSFRLCHILNGGHDPYVVNPTTTAHDHTFGVQMSAENQTTHYSPRIVGIYMIPSVEYIISVLSVLRCGEAFMPLDPSWPKERILSIISSSKPYLIICRSSFNEPCHQLDGLAFPALYISTKENLREQYESSSALVWPCQKEVSTMFCYVMYTSGSSGTPKGVCGTEIGLINRFVWLQETYPFRGDESLLFKTSISFIDHLQEFLGPLLTTCTIVIPSFSELKENLFSIVNYLQAYSINRLVAVPSLMREILPALKCPINKNIKDTLKILVLSGEIFPISLYDTISELLPGTTILNLYGSTEVSGDCTYFDCKKLPSIISRESICSVPIGSPIKNCEVYLQSDEDLSNSGEIHVSGLCLCNGYISKNHSDFPSRFSHYKSGDFALKLLSGDLVFIGRKDRTVKINGQRISLEEIECNLREHEDIFDAAVVFNDGHLEGYLVTKTKNGDDENLGSSIRSWLVEKVPLAMIPKRFFCRTSFPMSSSGKVDYKLLTSSRVIKKINTRMEDIQSSELLDLIKQAFCNALKIDEMSCDDDFFALGGDSISAAHASHTLRINMRLLYNFPTPFMLQRTLLKDRHLLKHGLDMHADSRPVKHLKMGSGMNSKITNPAETFWNLTTIKFPTSFSRCNKVMSKVGYEGNNLCDHTKKRELYKYVKGFLREVWKVCMGSCVDASPLVVFRENDVYIYIGSHSHAFLCIHAKSGSVQWEVKLEGRVECSAAILGDFSQVVVGCYQGNIYFLDSFNGSISWTFQTRGEVKSQPVVDSERHLVWCGSYDHNIYALDYANKCCSYILHCGGSIYGSPVIDEVHNMLYIASTSGHVTTICLKTVPFSKMWVQDLGAPIFGSLSLDSQHGNVICCLVNGHVIALNSSGSVVWRGITAGPIFAGPCISYALPSQVLICSRDGCIYSFDLANGNLIWKHNTGDPIISAAYVDENLQLICVCTSSGRICLLQINSEISEEKNIKGKNSAQEYAQFDLKEDIFSSPVMIDGRIFIGCRDDYIHCIQLEDSISV